VKLLRKYLLFPFGLLYGSFSSLRIWLYTSGILKRYIPEVLTFSIGNLSAGGTGKTPHTIYLSRLLSKNYKVGILSRGYGRASRGYYLVQPDSTSLMAGDEPLLMKQLLGNEIPVVVCESRKHGLIQLKRDFPELDIVLMDDAFQHVQVNPGFSILLSDFNDPFFRDFPLPAGNLREWGLGKNRANLCVFTKCPDGLTDAHKKEYSYTFSTSKNTYFSSLVYGELTPLHNTHKGTIEQIILVTGIANPQPMMDYLNKLAPVRAITFRDHHQFSPEDISRIHDLFGNFTAETTIIVTTAKDAVRLQEKKLNALIRPYPWFVLPLEVEIDRKQEFEHEIIQYVEQNK
jgi:tetraacyldisaccharide 4'-kinase